MKISNVIIIFFVFLSGFAISEISSDTQKQMEELNTLFEKQMEIRSEYVKIIHKGHHLGYANHLSSALARQLKTHCMSNKEILKHRPDINFTIFILKNGKINKMIASRSRNGKEVSEMIISCFMDSNQMPIPPENIVLDNKGVLYDFRVKTFNN